MDMKKTHIKIAFSDPYRQIGEKSEVVIMKGLR
jgi:hypothetical protein